MYKLQITGRGMKASEPMKEYIESKVEKISRLIDKNIYVHCEIIKVSRKVGIPHNFQVEFTIHIPKANIRVEKEGSNLYEILDETEPIIKRMLNKYKSKMRRDHKKIKFSEAMSPLM